MKARFLTLLFAILLLALSPQVSAQSARDCLNPRLTQQGAVIEQRFRDTNKETGERVVANSTSTVIGQRRFKGKDATLVEMELSVTQMGSTSTIQTRNYFKYQRGKARIRSFGGTGRNFVDGVEQGSSEVVIEPGLVQAFDLGKGDRHTQKQQVTVVSSTIFGSVTDRFSQRITRIYQGRQNVRGPLGNRQACKFRVIEWITQRGVTTKFVRTEWIDVKSGLTLKETSKESTLILLRASIDGASI